MKICNNFSLGDSVRRDCEMDLEKCCIKFTKGYNIEPLF